MKSTSMKKRAMALALALCMVFTSVGGSVTDWFAAFAEEEAAFEGESFEASDGDSDDLRY